MPSPSYFEGLQAQPDAILRVASDIELRRRLLRVFDPESTNVLVGIGASYAALASTVYELRAVGIPCLRTDGTDFPNMKTLGDANAIIVSQGGRSREVIEFAQRLSDAGASTIALTNSLDAPLAQVCDDHLSVGGFADSRVSTVGLTATLTALGVATSPYLENDSWSALAPLATADSTTAALTSFLDNATEWTSLDFATTAEALTFAEASALLVREGLKLSSTGFGTRAYLHGPMDTASATTAHVVLGGERELLLADQLAEQSHSILLITADVDVARKSGHPCVLLPANLSSMQLSLAGIVIAQQLVLRCGEMREQSIDATVFTRLDTKLDAVPEKKAN